MEFHINITEQAKEEVIGMIKSENYDTKIGLRLWVAGGGCAGLQYAMAIDTEEAQPEDYVQDEGLFNIYIDNFSTQYLNEATIDWSTNLLGGGFKIDNPNVQSCGCGSSFTGDSEYDPGCGGCQYGH